MDERDFYGIAATIALLALLGILQSKILARHDEKIAKLAGDVEFLKDHTVARETEARP